MKTPKISSSILSIILVVALNTTFNASAATITGAPTNISASIVSATSVKVNFITNSNSNGSGTIVYTVTSSPGGITATGSSSGITIAGLTSGTEYTFTVSGTDGTNTYISGTSNAITPKSINTITWSGSTNSDWGTASNWTGGILPGANDKVSIPTGKTVSISASTVITVNSISITGTGSLINNGTLNIITQSSDTYGITFSGGSFDNEGALTINTSYGLYCCFGVSNTTNLIFNGAINLTAGATKTIFLSTANNTSTIIQGSGFQIGTSGAPVNYGILSSTVANTNLTINSGVTISAFLNGTPNGFYLSNSSTVSNNGILNITSTISGGSLHAIQFWQTTASATSSFTNSGTTNITGFDQPIVLGGTQATGSANLINTGTFNITASATVGYCIYSSGTGINSITNSGTLNLSGTTAIQLLANSYGGSVTNSGIITITKGIITSNGTLGTFSTYPTLNNNSGGTINFNYGTSAGTTAAISKVIINNNSGAKINGSCTFSENTLVTNNGSTLSPGDFNTTTNTSGIGKIILTPSGSVFTLNGNLNIQVNGKTTAGTDYDQIAFASTCALTLQNNATIAVTTSYTPAPNDRVSVIITTTKSGSFSTQIIPEGWHVDYATATDIAVKYAAITWTGVAGDGLWSTASNWSSLSVPVSSSDVYISTSHVTINSSTIAAINSLSLTSGANLINSGSLNIIPASPKVGIYLNSASIDNEGILNVNSSYRCIELNGTNTLTFNGVTNFAGSNAFVTNNNSATTLSGTGFTIGSVGAPSAYGLISSTSTGSTFCVSSGTTISVYSNSTAVVYMSNSAIVINNGTLNISTSTTGTGVHAIQIWETSGLNATFTNGSTGNLTLTGYEQPTVFGGSSGYGRFDNSGTANITTSSAASAVGIMSTSNLANIFINSGTLNISATLKSVSLNAKTYGGYFTNTGTINITKGYIYSGGASGDYNTLDNNSGGIINFNYGVSSGTTQATNAAIINNNNGATINGSCTFGLNTLVTLPGSTLSPGDYSGGVSSIGKIIITPTSGTFTLAGNINLQVNGKTIAGTDYDQITFSSPCTLTLSGNPVVNLMVGYSPAYNDRISIISSNALTGSLGSSSLPLSWVTDYASADIGVKYPTVVPEAPASVAATAGNTRASITFTAPVSNGGANITNYTVTSNPGSITASGVTSPIIINGLSNGTAYTFTVTATNSVGTGTGTTSGSVTPDAMANNINVSSSSSTELLTLTPVSDVVVENGVLLTINTPININSLTISGGGQVTNTSSLTASTMTINSNGENGTGTYNDYGGTTNVSSATVNQYIASTQTGVNGRNWYISSPVGAALSSTIINATGNSLVGYTESTGQWDNAGTSMDVMKGYIAVSPAQNTTVAFSGGTLNTGLQSISNLSYNGATKRGFNLIGNPYPSYLNWDDATISNVLTTIWYRSKSTGSYLFQTYNSAGNQGANGGTNLIPPMQAFWVRATDAINSLSFDNTMRSHQDQSVVYNRLKISGVTKSLQQVLRLEVSNGVNKDETVLYKDKNASDNFDVYDSPKMTNANVAIPEIFTIADAESLSINGINKFYANQEFLLGFTTGQANTFNIKASEINNFDVGTQIILRDNLANKEWNLMDGLPYTFKSDITTSNISRFSIIFKTTSINTGNDNSSGVSNSILVYSNTKNRITVNCVRELIADAFVSVYNSMGQKLDEETIKSTTTILSKPLTAGIYFVNVVVSGKNSIQKIIIN